MLYSRTALRLEVRSGRDSAVSLAIASHRTQSLGVVERRPRWLYVL